MYSYKLLLTQLGKLEPYLPFVLALWLVFLYRVGKPVVYGETIGYPYYTHLFLPFVQLSIEERLEEIDLSTVSAQKGRVKGLPSLQMDNFAVLLVQGLESQDAEILNVSERVSV